MKTKKMLGVAITLLVFVCLLAVSCSTAPKTASQKEQDREAVLAMANQTLQNYYAKNPGAQQDIENAAGYAVFSDVGFKAMFMGAAKGAGVAINNATKQPTFMKMHELQPGLGIGAEKYRVILIFDTPEAFNKFVQGGWELGANTMATAKTKTKGGGAAGAISFSEGVRLVQVSDQGAIVGVSLTGTKFSRDKELA